MGRRGITSSQGVRVLPNGYVFVVLLMLLNYMSICILLYKIDDCSFLNCVARSCTCVLLLFHSSWNELKTITCAARRVMCGV